MKYTVTVMEHTGEGDTHVHPVGRCFTGRTIGEAWRICEKHARRGVNRFGGGVTRLNRGVRGGVFPASYRSATIRMDVNA